MSAISRRNGLSTGDNPLSSKGISRRTALIGGIAATAGLLGGFSAFRYFLPAKPETIPGKIIGANHRLGHILRDGASPPPSSESKTGIVIVGGGVAGLSAGWELKRRGFGDFAILEMDNAPGGNSVSGRNTVSAYPWGAHYVPLPGPETVLTRELFEELGVITGYAKDGRPIYDEYYLCAYPQERLLINGQWHEGIVASHGASTTDIAEFDAFFAAMDGYKRARGVDGKRAFAIPVAESSRDARFTELDSISMSEFMARNGWRSKRLLWSVDYSLRDDYGAGMGHISAWAGIHYFASRNGTASNADPSSVVTWPEGNGWIVNRLADKMEGRVRTNALVTKVESSGFGAVVDCYDAVSRQSFRIHANAVILAAPRFIADSVYRRGGATAPEHGAISYSPWMVANVTLSSPPGGHGAPLSWDNVRYGSRSLGYVVANHQALASRPKETVITMYFPLDHAAPEEARAEAVAKTADEWKTMALTELSAMHHGIERDVKNIDVWVWGHAMARPSPGFMWGQGGRLAMARSAGEVFFAHSDMSGISIFEEAQYHGVMAAREALKRVQTRTGGI